MPPHPSHLAPRTSSPRTTRWSETCCTGWRKPVSAHSSPALLPRTLGASAATGSPCLHPPGHPPPCHPRLLLVPRTQKSFLKAPHTLKANNYFSGPFGYHQTVQLCPTLPVGGLSTPPIPVGEWAGFSRYLGFLPPLPSDTGVPVSGITLSLDPPSPSCCPSSQPHPRYCRWRCQASFLLSGQPLSFPSPVLQKGHQCAGWVLPRPTLLSPTATLQLPGPLGAPRWQRWVLCPLTQQPSLSAPLLSCAPQPT
ncbi:hypothetical protein D623_10002494 [Myotis brandtii]|uniref:Uncharacterized protein n=1 Tax=Myotis brandtii TaxID=109478 RepID=S7MKR8_MYOBR|nr:hypothetical protein D623_10002494 [Myotis brandtii]